ncbi:transposable element with KRAB [Octopus vulgaris]|uniref:Transposable element with KRAB n=1 Tax=Octopus vulgaris TaxID=6645 RepID=A0AA36B2W9_OCTVU|nr:transposable element with KRAB [Octopus vulgaris]
MTSDRQTLDLVINKPFKDYLRMEVIEYVEHRMEEGNQRGNFVKSNFQEIVNWVKNSWNKITNSCVANALRARYLDKKCSFKESCIANHERLESKFLQEMDLQEIQSEVQDLMIYNDIPEKDEMFALN